MTPPLLYTTPPHTNMRGMQRARKPVAANKSKAKAGAPTLQDFIGIRDYTGALALLEFKLKCQDGDTKDLLMWIGYTAYHLSNYKRAEDAYKELLDAHDVAAEVHLFLACCYFYQQMYEEAEAEAVKGPPNELQNRLLFNIFHRKGDEDSLMQYHQNLKDTKEDQLSLAGVHYLRSHHQEVTPVFHIHSITLCDVSCYTIPPDCLVVCVYVGNRYLQAPITRKSRRSCPECVRGDVLLQVGLL